MLRAVRAVGNGEAIFGPAIARRLIGFFAAPKPSAPPVFAELTDRESEILSLVALSRSIAKIAERPTLSPKTVRNHVSNILSNSRWSIARRRRSVRGRQVFRPRPIRYAQRGPPEPRRIPT